MKTFEVVIRLEPLADGNTEIRLIGPAGNIPLAGVRPGGPVKKIVEVVDKTLVFVQKCYDATTDTPLVVMPSDFGEGPPD